MLVSPVMRTYWPTSIPCIVTLCVLRSGPFAWNVFLPDGKMVHAQVPSPATFTAYRNQYKIELRAKSVRLVPARARASEMPSLPHMPMNTVQSAIEMGEAGIYPTWQVVFNTPLQNQSSLRTNSSGVIVFCWPEVPIVYVTGLAGATKGQEAR